MMEQPNSACVFCHDAGSDFDWCRVCGRGEEDINATYEHDTPETFMARVRALSQRYET